MIIRIGFIIFFLIFKCKISLSQDSIPVTISFQSEWDGRLVKCEKYYTYSERLNYKCGAYEEENNIEECKIYGFYRNNLKDDIWSSVTRLGDTIYIGRFKNDKPTGQWMYFDVAKHEYPTTPINEGSSKIVQIIDMDKMEQIYPSRKEMKNAKVIINNNIVIKTLTKEPVMIGVYESFFY